MSRATCGRTPASSKATPTCSLKSPFPSARRPRHPALGPPDAQLAREKQSPRVAPDGAPADRRGERCDRRENAPLEPRLACRARPAEPPNRTLSAPARGLCRPALGAADLERGTRGRAGRRIRRVPSGRRTLEALRGVTVAALLRSERRRGGRGLVRRGCLARSLGGPHGPARQGVLRNACAGKRGRAAFLSRDGHAVSEAHGRSRERGPAEISLAAAGGNGARLPRQAARRGPRSAGAPTAAE